MSEIDFATTDFKAKVKAAIGAIEAKASCEVLVAVRRSSGGYRDADFLGGASLALATLIVMLFVPREFSLAAFPVQCVIAFVVGAFVTSRVPALRRALSTPKRRASAVRVHARATFVELGAARTHHRRAVLVFASMLERRVEIVADQGLDALAEDDAFKRAQGEVAVSVAVPDAARFLAALDALGAAIAAHFPHEASDTNELPDELDEALGAEEDA